MKAWHVHYLNKYPGGQVCSGEDYVDVYDADGAHRLAVRKNGAGQWSDVSEEMGLPDRHDLSPIPKDARVHKLQKDGKIGLDEKHEERRAAREKLVKNGKVASIEEAAAAQAE
jgi:hypothetical protein